MKQKKKEVHNYIIQLTEDEYSLLSSFVNDVCSGHAQLYYVDGGKHAMTAVGERMAKTIKPFNLESNEMEWEEIWREEH